MRIRHCLVVPFAFAALFGASVYPHANDSLAAALSAEQSASYKSVLEQARQGRDVVLRLGECLAGYLADLQDQVAKSEQALGEALRRQKLGNEQALAIQARQLVVEEEARLDAEKVRAQASEFEQARAEQQEQAEALSDCQVWAWGDPLDACKWGEDLFKSLHWMKDAEAELGVAQERLRGAEEAMRQTQGQLLETRQQLAEAEQDSEVNRVSIAGIEALISTASKERSAVNIKIQDYNILILAFEQTLEAASAVDTDDARIRQVNRLSAEINTLTTGAPAFVAATELSLPEDVKQKCSR